MLRIKRALYCFSKFVKVEYCMAWKYDTDFDALKDRIRSQDPTIYVKGIKTPTSKSLLSQEVASSKCSTGRMSNLLHSYSTVPLKGGGSPTKLLSKLPHISHQNEWADIETHMTGYLAKIKGMTLIFCRRWSSFMPQINFVCFDRTLWDSFHGETHKIIQVYFIL